MHNKTICLGPVSKLKPSSQKKIEELKSCKKMSKVLLPIFRKVGHFMQFSVSGCSILINFLLLGYLCQCTNRLDVGICSIKYRQQIKNSIDLNHFNK